MPDPSIQTPPPPRPSGGPATEPATPPEAPARESRSALFIVFLVVVIDLLGFGIVLPLLPRYGKDYVGPLFEAGAKDWRAGAIIGVLMSSFSAMQFLFAPVWGRVSDRVGRRPILLLGLTGSVLFYLLFGYASDLPATAEWAAMALTLIFVARIGAGVAGATIATAQAVIADCTPPERRKHGMALIGAAFGIGFTIGPLVAYASLGSGRHGAIGYAAAGLSFLALVLGLILLPETRRFDLAPPLRKGWIDWRATRDVLRSPGIGPVVLTFFLATLGFAAFESTLAVLIGDTLKLSEQDTLPYFAFVGLILALTQGFYRRLANRVSEASFMAAGIYFMGLGLLLLGGFTWLADRQEGSLALLRTWLLLSLAIAVIGFALMTPSVQALISRRTDPARQGEVLGVNQSASALARILGPVFGLTLYFGNHLLPYAFAAGLLLVMLPLMPRIRRGPEWRSESVGG